MIIKCPHCGNDDLDRLEHNGAAYAPDRLYLCTMSCAPEDVADRANAGQGDDSYCGQIFNPYEEAEEARRSQK